MFCDKDIDLTKYLYILNNNKKLALLGRHRTFDHNSYVLLLSKTKQKQYGSSSASAGPINVLDNDNENKTRNIQLHTRGLI